MNIAHLLHSPILHAPILEMTALLLIAAFLGGCIGWERERHERPAGLRTHILVCLGSALITIVGNSEPNSGGRIAAQIVTGVGFLGAGTIIRDGSGGPVRGLTTAASLWAVAGLGIAVGFGGYYAALAGITTCIMLFVLTTLNHFEDTLNKRRKRQELTLVMSSTCDILASLKQILQSLHDNGVRTRDLRFKDAPDGRIIQLALNIPPSTKRDTLDEILSRNSDIVHHSWE